MFLAFVRLLTSNKQTETLLKSIQSFDLAQDYSCLTSRTPHPPPPHHMAYEIFTIPWRQNTTDIKGYRPDTQKFGSFF